MKDEVEKLLRFSIDNSIVMLRRIWVHLSVTGYRVCLEMTRDATRDRQGFCTGTNHVAASQFGPMLACLSSLSKHSIKGLV